MTWKMEGNRVTAPNGRVVAFPFDVKETLEAAGELVVLVQKPPGKSFTENVFAVSENGEVLWQIEPVLMNSTNPKNWYSGIIRQSDGIVRVYNWNGSDTWVDIKTGKVLRAYEGR